MKTKYIPDYWKNAGAWRISIPCECKQYLHAQDSQLGENPPFQFNNDFENPTFTPSMKPYSHFCNLKSKEKDGKRCHFFVKNGIAEHCADSKYPNQKMPLNDID